MVVVPVASARVSLPRGGGGRSVGDWALASPSSGQAEAPRGVGVRAGHTIGVWIAQAQLLDDRGPVVVLPMYSLVRQREGPVVRFRAH